MQSFLAKLKLQSAPSGFDKTQVFLSAILRDKQDNIVAGYNNFADCPAVGSTTPFRSTSTIRPRTQAAIFTQPSGRTGAPFADSISDSVGN